MVFSRLIIFFFPSMNMRPLIIRHKQRDRKISMPAPIMTVFYFFFFLNVNLHRGRVFTCYLIYSL